MPCSMWKVSQLGWSEVRVIKIIGILSRALGNFILPLPSTLINSHSKSKLRERGMAFQIASFHESNLMNLIRSQNSF